MLASFLITFREGLEAFLIIGILSGFLIRLEARNRLIWLWFGAVAGVLASVLAAIVLQVVLDQFSNTFYRGVLTLAIMLTAVTILTTMVIWMQKQAREGVDEAKRQLAAHVSAGRVLAIALLAFVSVLREGIETVLFFSALSYSGQGASLPGALAGLVLSALAVWAMLGLARGLPLQSFFRISGVMLIVIAAGLLSSAINQAQGLGLALGPMTPIFDLSAVLSDQTGFGIFLRGLVGYNATPTAAQFAGWLVFLVTALSLWRRGLRPTNRG